MPYINDICRRFGVFTSDPATDHPYNFKLVNKRLRQISLEEIGVNAKEMSMEDSSRHTIILEWNEKTDKLKTTRMAAL